MIEKSEAIDRIAEIQKIVERTTVYTVLPGVPSIIGGLLAILGGVATYLMTNSFDFQNVIRLSLEMQFGFCLMWAFIGLLAIGQEVVLVSRAATKKGIRPFGRPGKIATLSLTPAVLVAIVLTIEFLSNLQMQYIAPVWMMCYGVGVYTAGLFSFGVVRVLGLSFLVAGIVGLFFLSGYGVLLVMGSFGLFHIIFGIVVLSKQQREM